jgi:hypothetical protein
MQQTVKYWHIYSKIVGVHVTNLVCLVEYGLSLTSKPVSSTSSTSTVIHVESSSTPSINRLGSIRYVIVSELHNNGADEETWNQYFALMPQLSHVSILSKEYNYLGMWFARAAAKNRPSLLFQDDFSLKPCVQCNVLCFPPSPCGTLCKYSGTYNCENCIIDNEKICQACTRMYHTNCTEVHELTKKAERHANATCLECLIHSRDSYDNYNYCEACLKLCSCYISGCDTKLCNHHMQTCNRCEERGCIFHIMRIMETHTNPEDHSSYLTCPACYRVDVAHKSSNLSYYN